MKAKGRTIDTVIDDVGIVVIFSNLEIPLSFFGNVSGDNSKNLKKVAAFGNDHLIFSESGVNPIVCLCKTSNLKNLLGG